MLSYTCVLLIAEEEYLCVCVCVQEGACEYEPCVGDWGAERVGGGGGGWRGRGWGPVQVRERVHLHVCTMYA